MGAWEDKVVYQKEPKRHHGKIHHEVSIACIIKSILDIPSTLRNIETVLEHEDPQLHYGLRYTKMMTTQ